MAVIHRNVGGSYTMLNTDVGTAAAAHWFIADSFAFGVEREMQTEERESSGDVLDFTGIDGGAARSSGGAAGGIVSEGQGYGLFIAAATASSGDVLDFTAIEASEAAASTIKIYICPSDPSREPGRGGMDDLAMHRQIDPDSDGLPTVPVVDLQFNQPFEILI